MFFVISTHIYHYFFQKTVGTFPNSFTTTSYDTRVAGFASIYAAKYDDFLLFYVLEGPPKKHQGT